MGKEKVRLCTTVHSADADFSVFKEPAVPRRSRVCGYPAGGGVRRSLPAGLDLILDGAQWLYPQFLYLCGFRSSLRSSRLGERQPVPRAAFRCFLLVGWPD